MKMDGSKTKDPTDVKGGGDHPEPGTYLVVCKEACEYPTGRDGKAVNGATIDVDVIAGTVPGQEGKTHRETLWRDQESKEPTQEYIDKCMRVAMSFGVLRPGEVRDVDWDNEMNGRVAVVKLVKRLGKDKRTEYTNVDDFGYAWWPINHKDVAAVVGLPSAQEALKVLGLAGGGAVGQTAASAAGQQQPQQPQTQPTTAKPASGWDNL